MGISFLWQQLLPFALTWSYHLKIACHFPVNTKFILFYKVEKKIQKPLAHFMNNMSIYVYVYLNRYNVWRLLAPQFTSFPSWWNSFHCCLKCWISNSHFKLGTQSWHLSSNNHSQLTGSKNISLWHLPQLHFLYHLYLVFILFAEDKDLMRWGNRRFCSSSQRPETCFFFSLLMWCWSRILPSLDVPSLYAHEDSVQSREDGLFQHWSTSWVLQMRNQEALLISMPAIHSTENLNWP